MSGPGVVVWLTGRPASGKSTLARAVSSLMNFGCVPFSVSTETAVFGYPEVKIGFVPAIVTATRMRIALLNAPGTSSGTCRPVRASRTCRSCGRP